MRECTEYEITIEKLLNVVHSYTNPIRICVIIGDAWLTCEEARGTRRLHDFYLTKAHTEYDDEEKERLLKYYKDVPVWNITAWHDVDCREIRYGIEARCRYKDVREGYLAEKADLKRAKEREPKKENAERRREEQTMSEDLISRQAAIDIVEFECGEWSGLAKTIAEEIKQLPSAEPKTGRWIADGQKQKQCYEWMHCSVCGFSDIDVPATHTNFCPNCGADMRGEQDG